MSATAISRTYSVLRKTKIGGRKYDPLVGTPQFYRPGPEVSEQTIQAMVDTGHIRPYYGEVPGDEQADPKGAPSTTNRAAKTAARKDRTVAATSRPTAKRETGDTPRKQRAAKGKPAEVEPEDGEEVDPRVEETDETGAIDPEPGVAGATSDNPAAPATTLPAHPGDGLPSDDPGTPPRTGDNATSKEGGAGNMQGGGQNEADQGEDEDGSDGGKGTPSDDKGGSSPPPSDADAL